MPKVQTIDVIKYSAVITESEGYVRRSENQNVMCTADKVLDAIEDNSVSDEELSSTKDRVAQWLEYVNDTAHQTGEYFDNIRAEICKPMIDEIKIGLIASSFASFDKHRLFKAKNEMDKNSRFLGEEGDKITFNIANYRLIKTGTSKYGSGGRWYLYHIHDEFNNIIVYFADHDCENDFKNFEKASATISKLSTFNEVKQTNVSKLRFL